MVGSECCCKNRGGKGASSIDTTQVLNARMHMPKDTCHAHTTEVRLEDIPHMRLMTRRDCGIATGNVDGVASMHH